MCGFCTVWMCEAYVIMWVWIWWVAAFLDYTDWGFSVLFLSCKANARVKLAKLGHVPHLYRIIVFCVVLVIVLCYWLYAVLLLLCCMLFVLLRYYLCCPMYCMCVLYDCHRGLTQLQSTNISISISKINGKNSQCQKNNKRCHPITSEPRTKISLN
jgi:hypothetical protein